MRTTHSSLWKQSSPQQPHQGEHLASETPSGISSCVVEVHSKGTRAARQAGSSCQKWGWRCQSCCAVPARKFCLVLSGGCKREVSGWSCVESRGCYCCRDIAVPVSPPQHSGSCSSPSPEDEEGPSWLLSLPCLFQKKLLVWQGRGKDSTSSIRPLELQLPPEPPIPSLLPPDHSKGINPIPGAVQRIFLSAQSQVYWP